MILKSTLVHASDKQPLPQAARVTVRQETTTLRNNRQTTTTQVRQTVVQPHAQLLAPPDPPTPARSPAIDPQTGNAFSGALTSPRSDNTDHTTQVVQVCCQGGEQQVAMCPSVMVRHKVHAAAHWIQK